MRHEQQNSNYFAESSRQITHSLVLIIVQKKSRSITFASIICTRLSTVLKFLRKSQTDDQPYRLLRVNLIFPSSTLPSKFKGAICLFICCCFLNLHPLQIVITEKKKVKTRSFLSLFFFFRLPPL